MPLPTVFCRRSLTALLALLLTPLAVASPEELRFDVRLGDKSIGEHVYRLTPTDDGMQVVSEVTMRVKLLFVTVFRYEHRSEEIWRDGCLAAIDSNTRANMKRFAVTGEAVEDGFDLTANDEPQSLAGCVRAFAYWNRELLEGDALLNPQTGVYEETRLAYLGEESFAMDEGDVQVERYRLDVPKGRVEICYAVDDGRWVALESTFKDRLVRYLRKPDAAAGGPASQLTSRD